MSPIRTAKPHAFTAALPSGPVVAVQSQRSNGVTPRKVLSIPPDMIPALREALEAAELVALATGAIDSRDYTRLGITPPGGQRTPFDEEPRIRATTDREESHIHGR